MLLLLLLSCMLMIVRFRLNETAETEVLLDDDICGRGLVKAKFRSSPELTINSCHHKADLCCIGSAGKVGVDLLSLMLVQAHESVQNVVAGLGVIFSSFVVGEVVFHWAHGQLLLEAIDLVQEQNDRSLDEPPGVANGVEEGECFLHTVDGLILEKKLVVLGNGNKEEDSGNVLEAVNPLLSLGPLSSNIEHAIGEVSNDERSLSDTCSLDTGAENILIVGHVVRLCDALNVVEVAGEK
jgi:hypothetical protein